MAKKIVVLADIESVRIPFDSFEKSLKEVAKMGEIAGIKFYGYSAKRTKDYAEFSQANNYDALSSLPRKRKGKLDLRQVIDAVSLAQTGHIDAFYILYGNGDIKPLISYLKTRGLEVYAGVAKPDLNSALCNKTIVLENAVFAAEHTAPKAKKAATNDDDDLLAQLTALLK